MEEEIIEKDMTPILLEDLGMRYPTKKSKHKRRYGLYQCQYCGEEFETQISNINTGNTKSCGCFSEKKKIEASSKHNCAYHPLYPCWKSMKHRCYNLNHQHYNSYGGRGIQVCERWLDVGNFIEDMYPSFQKGLSLDRIDVDGNYEPDNCRWTTKEIQSRNTRDIQSNNTSGFRGVFWDTNRSKWLSLITMNNRQIYLGRFSTALEAAKAYERYVRLNNLEHNFTPALTPEEVEALYEKES